MKKLFKRSFRPTAVAAGALLASGLFHAAPVRAADPYDQALEKRVEALERELNIMENDSKGKNVETGTDVPTFARASANVQQLTLSGELRFRDELSNVDSQTAAADAQANRLRFRFRLFADYKLNDNFFVGAAVQTSQASDSGNTTFTEGFDNYSLYLWRFFMGWHTSDDSIKIVAGKQPNPFYEETEMLWDADVSPTGLTEQINIPLSSQFSLGLIAGQFIFYDNSENAFFNTGRATATYVTDGDNNSDAYLAYQQLVATFKATNDLTFTAAPGYFFYPGHGGTNAVAGASASNGGINPSPVGATAGGGTLQNSAAFNSANSERNLSIATFNGDVKLGLGAVKLKVYGQLAYNFYGGGRDAREYNQPQLEGTIDKIAYSAGITVGSDYQLKKRGDYLFLAEYRQVGLGSVDPNLNDSDWNFSRLGFKGFKVAGSYAFEPWLIATVTYYGASNLEAEKNLNIGVGNYNASQIIQFDLTTKF